MLSLVRRSGLALLLLALGTAAPGHAATGFRYWNFWVVDSGAWVLPQEVTQERELDDFAVDGWHFGVWGDDGGRPPRSVAAFSSLCPNLVTGSAPAGKVRVAVVIDPGTNADAPDAESPPAIRTSCLLLPRGATSQDALERAATSLRSQSGTVCAINGYPETECAPAVGGSPAPVTGSPPAATAPAPSARPTQQASTQASQRAAWNRVSPMLLTVLGSALLLGGFAVAVRQRPKQRPRSRRRSRRR